MLTSTTDVESLLLALPSDSENAALISPPGLYRAGNLKLAPGSHLVGTRGATRLVLTQGPSLIWGSAADHVFQDSLSTVTVGGCRSSAVSCSWNAVKR